MRHGLPCRSHIVSGLGNLNIFNSSLALEPTTGLPPAFACSQGRCLERLATPAQPNNATTHAGRMQGKNGRRDIVVLVRHEILFVLAYDVDAAAETHPADSCVPEELGVALRHAD